MNKVTKEELQKLLDNVDMEKLYKSTNNYFFSFLLDCQKEPSLHDKLLAQWFKEVIGTSSTYWRVGMSELIQIEILKVFPEADIELVTKLSKTIYDLVYLPENLSTYL